MVLYLSKNISVYLSRGSDGRYSYKGLLEGAYTEGEIDADDTADAIAKLREIKVTITSVKLSRGRSKTKDSE